jgi:HD superfamily phosphodiesterase
MNSHDYTNEIIKLMLDYNGTDVRRINHALKVFAFARNIGGHERCDERTQAIIEYASILHDIGLRKAEKIYSVGLLKYHEEIGPEVARELIADLEIESDVKDRIYFLIGNHHSYAKIDGIDFQILVEADLIVNIFEDDYSPETIASVKQRIFRTKAGKSIIDSMYLKT